MHDNRVSRTGGVSLQRAGARTTGKSPYVCSPAASSEGYDLDSPRGKGERERRDWRHRLEAALGQRIWRRETGRYWDASSGHIGDEAEEYAAAKDLAKRLEQATPLKNRVSERFLLDELFAWLQGTLESKREYPFIDFLAKKSSEAIAVHEIWICAHE
jgi:hypothetical protein